MKVIKIISENKRLKGYRLVVVKTKEGHVVSQVSLSKPKSGYKRVEAIVKIGDELYTRHLDIPNSK